MDKIALSDVLSGHNLNKINNNFSKIQQAINSGLLSNQGDSLKGDLDVNGKKLYNLAAPGTDNEPARLKDVRNAIYGEAGHTANLINFEPQNGIAANTVQGAVEQVQTNFKKSIAQLTINVKEYGAVGDGVADDTAAVNNAFNALVVKGGGVLTFPQGTYKFYIDVSGNSTFVKFEGNYSTFLPVEGENTIVFCDNTNAPGEFKHSCTQFVRCYFSGNNQSDYTVQLLGSCADFEFSSFIFAKVAGFYGSYAQYCRFLHCVFASNINNVNTWGCYLTGTDGAHRSNEVLFFRCQFFSNMNGLYVGGAEAVRIDKCTFQDTQNGTYAALYLHTDLAGFSARYTDIVGCWFEINIAKALLIGVAEGTNVERNKFFGTSARPCVIQSSHAYDIRFSNNSALSFATVVFNHPQVNNDTASVTLHGNNFWPVFNLDHPGPTFINGESSAVQMSRKDSILLTSGQVDKGNIPVVFIDNWYGVKTNVPKGPPTNIFSITVNPAGYGSYRVLNATLKVRSWDDVDAGGQFGASGHVQEFDMLIETTTGNPRVSISPTSVGKDLGATTEYQAPGNMQLTSAVSGNNITFQIQWPGSGTAASGMQVQTIAYTLSGAGTNSFYMTRF